MESKITDSDFFYRFSLVIAIIMIGLFPRLISW